MEVALHRSAWIEMKENIYQQIKQLVALHRSAWIEIPKKGR